METKNIKNIGYLNYFYQKILDFSNNGNAIWVFCMVAFLESSVFPLPPDILMIPMVLSNRNIAFKIAMYGTIFSVLGGILGYAIGYFLFKTLGSVIINTYGLEASFEKFRIGFENFGFWIIFLKGLTPIPYKLVTIASGAAQYPLKYFILASIGCRGLRFFILSTVLYFFREKAKILIEKHLPLFFLSGLAILILGFVLFKIF